MDYWIAQCNVWKFLKIYNSTSYTYRQFLLKKLGTFLKCKGGIKDNQLRLHTMNIINFYSLIYVVKSEGYKFYGQMRIIA